MIQLYEKPQTEENQMYYFILNPTAKSKGTDDTWQYTSRTLQQQGIPYRLCATQYSGHAGRLARDISTEDPHATIVVIGGDGSIHEVINGLENPGSVTLGVIPAGSANDFSKGMGISHDPRKALAAILHPSKTIKMDVGRISGGSSGNNRFCVSAGIGFDAAVCHEALSSPIKDALNRVNAGMLTYSLIAAKQIALYEPGPCEIRLDGERRFHFSRVFFIAVMNQRYEGGGLMMTPDAKPDDGVLNVFICSNMPKSKLIVCLPTAKFGKHVNIKGTHFLKGRSVEILCDRERPIHLDGESGGKSRTLKAGFESEKINVIVR